MNDKTKDLSCPSKPLPGMFPPLRSPGHPGGPAQSELNQECLADTHPPPQLGSSACTAFRGHCWKRERPWVASTKFLYKRSAGLLLASVSQAVPGTVSVTFANTSSSTCPSQRAQAAKTQLPLSSPVITGPCFGRLTQTSASASRPNCPTHF